MTVTELARITGYSISTVSKALSDSAEISTKAKEEILAAAVETGYYNKAIKRKKRIGAPKTVGIVCDEYSDFRVLRNLCRELEKAGFSSTICINEKGGEVLSHLGVDAMLFYKKESRAPIINTIAIIGVRFFTFIHLRPEKSDIPDFKVTIR